MTSAQAKLTTAEAVTAKARQALKADAVAAYVNGGNNPLDADGNVEGATNSLLRAEYINTLATNETEDIDQYHLATLQEQAAAVTLKQQEGAAQAEGNTLSANRAAVSAADAQLTSDQNQVASAIAQLKAQELAAEQAAARAAAARQAAAEAAAEQQAQELAAEAAQLQSQPQAVTVDYTPPTGRVRAAGARSGRPRAGWATGTSGGRPDRTPSTARDWSCGPTPRWASPCPISPAPSTPTPPTSRCRIWNPVTWCSSPTLANTWPCTWATGRSSRPPTPEPRCISCPCTPNPPWPAGVSGRPPAGVRKRQLPRVTGAGTGPAPRPVGAALRPVGQPPPPRLPVRTLVRTAELFGIAEGNGLVAVLSAG